MAETEYTSEAVTVSGSVLFLASDVLNITFGGSYIDSKGSLEMVTMPDVPQEVTDNIAAADYDFSSIGTYSDLAYTLVNVWLGAEYALSPKTSLTADVVYYDLTDDTGYVYGNESGSLYVFRTGIRIGL